MTDVNRTSPPYVALVAALRETFNPTALEAIRIQLREHRNGRSSLADLVRAIDDAADVTFDPGQGAHPAVRNWFARVLPRPSRVGDLIGPNDNDIPADVVEVVDGQGDTWRRAVGDERYAHEDGEEPDRSQEYDWVAVGGGWSTTDGVGWSTTDGVLEHVPLRVTRVAEQPA